MLKAFSKLASKSLISVVEKQLRKLRRKAFEAEFSRGFQKLEARRVLTVQAVFDPGLGSLQVDIAAGGNTQATLSALDANQFFLDTDGNAQFDLGSDIIGDKSALKSLDVRGANLGEFLWKDHWNSNWALDRITANQLASITLDVVGKVQVAQESVLSATDSVQLVYSGATPAPIDAYLQFGADLQIESLGNPLGAVLNTGVVLNTGYEFSVSGALDVAAIGGTVSIGNLQATSLNVFATKDILQTDADPNDFDIQAQFTLLQSESGSIHASIRGESLEASAMDSIVLKTQINSLIASASNDIAVSELDGLRLERMFTTANGAIKVQTLDGDIEVAPSPAPFVTIFAGGRGDILLETVNSGEVIVNGIVKSESGHITLNSDSSMTLEDRLRTSPSGSILLRSDESITIGNLSTQGARFSALAAGDIFIGSVNAGAGWVYLEAGNNISRSISGSDQINITALGASLIAEGKIGDSDPTNVIDDLNRNAITTEIGTLAARSATGVYVFEQTGLTVDRIELDISQVHFNSMTSTQTVSLEDVTTTNNGPIKLLTLNGDLVVNAGTTGTSGILASGSGDILLRTGLNGTVIANADIVSGSGHISIVTQDDLLLGDRLKTTAPGTIYLSSQGKVQVTSLVTSGVDIGIVADDDVILGTLNAGSGKVWINTTDEILDADNSNATINITASQAALLAGGGIGRSGTGGSANLRAITTQVDVLSASSDASIYIQEQDGLTIDRVSSTVQRVHFNSTLQERSLTQEDLSTTANGSILLQSVHGDIVVRPGVNGGPGVSANGSGNVLLQTLQSGTIVTGAEIVSGTGHITLNSFGDLLINENLQTSGPGTMYFESQGDIQIDALTTNNVHLGVVASGDIVLGTIDAGTANVSLTSSDRILDNGNLSGRNVIANGLTMLGTDGIGASDKDSAVDDNSNAITTSVNTLSARSNRGIYVQESNSVTVDRVTVVAREVNFNGSTSLRSVTREDLVSASSTPIKLQSIEGDITVNAGTAGTNGITANGSGDILLQTLNSGTIQLNSTIQSGRGHITLVSAEALVVTDRIRTTSPGTIVLRSDDSLTISNLSTGGARLSAIASGDILVGSIQAGTGLVHLETGSNIARLTSGSSEINITASGASLIAEGKIGDSDPTNVIDDLNRNAITTEIGTLAARSGTGVYVFEQTGLTIDRIEQGVFQVHFNSTTSTNTIALEDVTTTNNGPIKLLTLNGDLVVNAGTAGTSGIQASGSGDILLRTGINGTVVANADIVSGSGHISIVTQDDLVLGDRLKTTAPGTIYLSSQGKVQVTSLVTSGVDIGIVADDDVILGTLNAGSGKVWINTTDEILDSDNSNATINITASQAALLAGGGIGGTGVSGSTNNRAITTQVDVLSAKSDTSMFIQEQDGLTIDRVSSTVQRVHFNSTLQERSLTQEDLSTTVNGSILLQSVNGDIVVRPGVNGDPGVSANGSGNVLLQTLQSGTIVTGADIVSGTGHITLSSFGDLVINENLQTSGPGTLYLESLGEIQIDALTTNNVHLGVVASGDIVLGTIDAGTANVSLTSSDRILDNGNLSGRNVIANGLTMLGTDGIGASDKDSAVDDNSNAITTSVNTLSARSNGGIYVQESNAVTIDSVTVAVREVNFSGSTSLRSVTREDLVSASSTPIKLQSIEGDITVNAGTAGTNGITANGSGDILLQTLNSGTIVLNSTIQSGSGDITLVADDALVVTDRIRTTAPGTIVLRSDDSITIGSGGLSTNNVNLGVYAANDILVGSINAGSGRVLLSAGGDIARLNAGSAETNITAAGATFLAGGAVGGADTLNGNSDSNRNAITTNVTTLASRSGDGIFIAEQTGVIIDQVTTTLSQVNFNSTNSNISSSTEDLTTTNNGSILVQSLSGDIVVRPGVNGDPGVSANGSGNVLLQTLQSGTIVTGADVLSGTGHIALSSVGDLVINENLQTSGPGTLYLNSLGTVSVESLGTNNTNLAVVAGSNIILGSIQAGAGNVTLSAVGDILDNASLNTGRNVSANALSMVAGGIIGGSDTSSPVDINNRAITTAVTSLAAQSATGVYVQELNGVTITTVVTPVTQVRFNGSTTDRTSTQEDLLTTNNGPVKLQCIDGDITVDAGTAGTNGITANGSGDILLQTLNSGTIQLNSTIESGTGDITLVADDTLVVTDRIRTTSPGTIALRSDSSLTISNLSTGGASLSAIASGDILVGRIHADTGLIYLEAGNNIARLTSGSSETNITAAAASIHAGGRIGDSDLANLNPDSNRNAITTELATLAASSSAGIYIFEQTGVTVDRIEQEISQVHFNSRTTSNTLAMEDVSTTNNGPIKLLTLNGDLVVNAGTAGTSGIQASGSGYILLGTIASGTVVANADVVSGSGHISIVTQDDLVLGDRLKTTAPGTIYLSSQGEIRVVALTNSGVELGIEAKENVTLGVVDVGSSKVWINTTGSILDLDSSNTTINITASQAALFAGDRIGGADVSDAVNKNAITTQVDVLSAKSATGVFIQEQNGVTIDRVSSTVQRVNFNSTLQDRSFMQEDLSTTVNGSVILQSVEGDIVVKSGTNGDPGVSANGTGNVLLQTLQSGTIRTEAYVVSGSGHITLRSFGDLVINEYLRTSDPGTLYLESQGEIQVDSLTTDNVHLGLVAAKDIVLGTIDAGSASVSLATAERILDNDRLSGRNVIANRLTMSGGNGIGGADTSNVADNNRNAISTSVNTLSAQSGGGIYIQESNGVTVDSVTVVVQEVNFSGTTSTRSVVREDLVSTSSTPIKLQSVEGDIIVNAGTAGTNGITAEGAGDILLQTLDSGRVTLAAVVGSGTGNITVSSVGSVIINDTLKNDGAGVLWIESHGDVSLATLRNTGGNLGVSSRGDILLGAVDVGRSQVSLAALGDIYRGISLSGVPNLVASEVALVAGGSIGFAGLGSFGDFNSNALETNVDVLAAQAKDGVFIREIDGVTVGRVETELARVHFNSSRVDRSTAMEDVVTTRNGTIQIHSVAGDLVITSGSLDGFGLRADGVGDVDLRTIDQGAVILNSNVESTDGRISVDAKGYLLIDRTIATQGDVFLRAVDGSIDESSGSAKILGDELSVASGTFTHLHDTTVRVLNGITGTNGSLRTWQGLNIAASNQGDDFLDSLSTLDESTRESLRAHYRFADRYESVGYSLYVVNSKALTVGTVLAGASVSSNGAEQPTVYIQTQEGDLVIKNRLESLSRTDQAGGIVLVADGKLGIISGGVIQTRHIDAGQSHVQVINSVELRARVFDALEKPNPVGGLFTTRIIAQNNLAESPLPEVPTQFSPTKRQLQGVATHFGSAAESGFNLFVGYADGNLEQFTEQGDVYAKDNANRFPIEARPQALSSVGYLERSTPFTIEFLNSVQELPTDVVVRRADDFFLFQRDVPNGLNTFSPPNPAAETSTGFYDLTVQSHRVPDVISEGSDSGLPMPPPPDVDIPTARQPDPYTAEDAQSVTVQSSEFEDEPLQERKVRIVVARIRVAVEESLDPDENPENRKKRLEKQYIELDLPEDILGDENQISQSQINRIEDYLKKQPGTRAGRYVILEETSDGEKREIAYIQIGPEVTEQPAEQPRPESQMPAPGGNGSLPEQPVDGKPPIGPAPEDQSRFEFRRNPSFDGIDAESENPNTEKAWGILLGAYWLSQPKRRKENEDREIESAAIESEFDGEFSLRARRSRRLLASYQPPSDPNE